MAVRYGQDDEMPALTCFRRYLASFGAIVTILSLGFGAFTQQLIAYSRFAVPADETNLLPGNIPRTETWQKFTGNPAEGGMLLPKSNLGGPFA